MTLNIKGAAPDAGGDRAPGATDDQPAPVKDMKSLFDSFDVMHVLPEEAKNYIDGIQANLDAHFGNLKITRFNLSTPNGTVLFRCENYIIALLFDEMISAPVKSTYAPKSARIDGMIQEIQRNPHLEGVKVLNAILVRREDYPKVPMMSKFIGSMFLERTQMRSVKLSSLVGDGTQGNALSFVIDKDLRNVQRHIASVYPHGVLPKMDIGLSLFMPVSQHNRYAPNEDGENDRHILSIGAFTEFFPDATMTKFQPLVRITNISLNVPVPAFALLGICLAVEHFCTNRGWLEPYFTFGAKRPNLGNLYYDEKSKKLHECTTPEEVNTMAMQNCTEAALAIDIVQGLARPTIFTSLTDPAEKSRVESYIAEFFHLKRESVNFSSVFHSLKNQFIGYDGLPGAEVDTRSLTYLQAISNYGAARETVQPLMHWPRNGDDMMKTMGVIDQILEGFQSSHLCTTLVLNPEFTSMVAQCIAASPFDITSDGRLFHAGSADLSGAWQNMAGMPAITRSGYSPYQRYMKENVGFSGF